MPKPLTLAQRCEARLGAPAVRIVARPTPPWPPLPLMALPAAGGLFSLCCEDAEGRQGSLAEGVDALADPLLRSMARIVVEAAVVALRLRRPDTFTHAATAVLRAAVLLSALPRRLPGRWALLGRALLFPITTLLFLIAIRGCERVVGTTSPVVVVFPLPVASALERLDAQIPGAD